MTDAIRRLANRPMRHWQPAMLSLFWAMTLLTREPAEGDLRLGQRVHVDDGTCPQGQVKEVTGAKLSPGGLVRARKCVARSSVKQ